MTLPASPKRFYKNVATMETGEGFTICLDDRLPKTPAKRALTLPSLSAAQLVAKEWDAQTDFIVPANMPITRLVNVVIDRGQETRGDMENDIVRYAKTDLVCYRAPTPKSLMEAQSQAWDPIMAWAENQYGIKLMTTFEALAIAQPTASLEALAKVVQSRDIWRLTAKMFATGLAGSAIIGLALVDGLIDGEAAFKAIRVEEDWQSARWGVDPDEALIANARRLDLVAVGQLCAAL